MFGRVRGTPTFQLHRRRHRSIVYHLRSITAAIKSPSRSRNLGRGQERAWTLVTTANFSPALSLSSSHAGDSFPAPANDFTICGKISQSPPRYTHL
ncbi:hypothetical protein NL676_022900 [Syzygium grande]|nr:hypothetical protein NL676_022900 [Syzygium grande]